MKFYDVFKLKVAIADAYQEGYEAADEQKGAVKQAYDMERERAVQTLGEDVVAALDNDPVGTLAGMNEVDRQEAIAYVNARTAYEGMIDRISDDIDERTKASDKEIESHANKADGMIHPATMRGVNGGAPRKVYIVSGNVATREDGTIDKAKSSDFILVRDAETGEVKAASVDEFDTIDEVIDTATEKKSVAEQIANEYAGQQAVIIEGENGNVEGENGVQPEVEGQKGENAEKVVEEAQPVAQTALERVPKAENGEPVYEQADAETAWDAIMEQTNDEELATLVVEGMIADKEAALKKLENSKVREGVTVAEKIAAAQQRKAAIEKAKADLAKWEEIAGVKAKRAAAQAENVAPVAETAPVEESAPVVENSNVEGENGNVVETPQATNEMQEADLENAEKGEKGQKAVEGEVSDTPSLLDVVKTLYSKGKEVASKLFQRSFFDVAKTPKFMQELGLRGDRFTIKYGVIARHLGKDGSHDLSEKDWEQLPQALQNPFAISKLTDKKDSYRIYTTLQTESGEFVVVGADVKNAGREIEVNAVSTVFGRRNNANLPKNEEVIYRSKEITPEQSSLLERPNFAQYPTEQELSTDEGTTQSANEQEKAQKSGETAENGGEKMYSPEELAEAKEQLGELNATSAPEFAARLFSIKPWKTLEEANAALKELLASYGETLNGQSLAVMPFLDKAQGLIREYNKSQEPRSMEIVLENGDKLITNYNSRGEVTTVATERDGKVVSVDSYDEGVLFEHTEYDTNGVSTSVTRYDKNGNVVSTQVFENSGVEKNRSGKVKAKQEKASQGERSKGKTESESKPEVEKIEDVGEKIGGAKKDRFAEGMARIKAELEETDETLTDKLAKLPVSQVFNFDLEKLREGGISNEAISFIKIVKDYLPAKPRKTYKIRSWVNNTLALYKLCLEAGTNWDRVNTLLNGPQFTSSSLKEQFDAYMAIGGFDSGMNIGNAKLRQLDKTSGSYDENGQFVTLAGKWYVRDAGKHGGIYDTKEEAVNALKAFAGDKAGVTSSGKKKEVKFAVYQRRQDKSIFIAVKGKSDIVIQDGFKSSKEAFDYIEANNAELQERYRALLDKTNADFEDNRPREGRDYRDGKDIPAEEFRTAFGFRGVEFGNWMTQEDRRKALNECYDALMDLAAVCKVSPQALSLGGTLGMAFGARGGGRFSAHYEPGKLVINLTKTKGAGSLAHEWFHALDNYFAKMGSEGLDVYATAGEGLFPEGVSSIGKRYYDRKSGQMLTEEEYNERMNSHEVRREMADAWKSLMETLKKSDYYKRSAAYAGLHNSKYWARPTELGARAFSTWVENELSKQGASNDYLANNPRFLVSEATDEQSRFMPYPFDADATWMEEAFGNLFEVMQEKTTEDGKAVLYSIAEDAMLKDRGTEAFERATKVTMEAVERLKANGLDIEVVSQEEADAMDANRVSPLRTTDGKVYGWTVDGKIRLTPDGINPDTPVHEYAHLWGADVEKNNPKLWNKVVEAMKLSPVWNEVANDANYSDIHSNDSRMASEVLARLSGGENYRRTMEQAEKEIANANGVFEMAERISSWAKVKDALKSFWNWVQRNVFHTEPMDWQDFVDDVVGRYYGVSKVQRLQEKIGSLARDVLNAVFKRSGIDIDLAEPVNVEQVAVVETESGEVEAENGSIPSVDTEENASQAASEPQARNRNMDREAWKKAFKKGGEKAYDLMYELHGGIVSAYPKEFLEYLKGKIGVADDVANVIEGAHDFLAFDFKIKNPELFKKRETKKVEDVHSLLATKGYSMLEHTMDNGRAIGVKMMYRDEFIPSGKTDASYTPGTIHHGRTVICYYNHPEINLTNQYVFTVTKDNAMETPTAYELVADPSLMTPEWAEYLGKIGRKSEDGTYNLEGLMPNFNDPFSLSHLMIRVNKTGSHDIETISRYNHGAFNKQGLYESIAGQPNATLDNNLDKLVDGLHESLMDYKQLEAMGTVPLGDKMIVANDGKIYRFNDIKGGMFIGDGFWVDQRNDAHVINPGKEKLVGEFLYGGGKVRNVSNGTEIEIHGLKFTENGVEFYTGGEEVTETREIEIKGEKRTVEKKVIKGDAKNVITFKNGNTHLETESADSETIDGIGRLYDVYAMKGDNLTEAGRGFLENCFWVRKIDFPNLEKAGDECFNASLDYANLPNLREVGTNCFNRVSGHNVPSLPNLEKVGANFMYSVGLMGEDVNIDFPKLREVGNFFMKNAQPSVVSLPSLETCGEGFMKGSMRGVNVDLPNLTKAGWEFFGGGFSVLSLNAPKLTDVQNDFMEGNQEIRQQIMEQADAVKEEVRFRKMNEHADLNRQGNGPLTDREVVMESDVYSKVLGKPRYYGKRQREFVARQRRRMAEKARQVADKLNLDNVEVLESTEGLTGKKATSKGWFDPRTGKITVVVPNHGSTGDIVETVLHEAVAHYGLRKLFGKNFNNFLDNVYRNVTSEIRAEITELAKKHGWDFHTATEEYLASLAENTNFEKVNPSLWSNIKSFFMKMLAKVGITLDEPLGDNELRYILWRSHQNLVNPGWFNVFGQAEDIAKQYELGVGNYASGEVKTENGSLPSVAEATVAAEDDSALLHREGGAPGSAREEYERKVRRPNKSGSVKVTENVAGRLVEAYQDSMRALKVLQDAIATETGKPIADNENAYMAENRMSSTNQAQTEAYMRDYYAPLMEEVRKMIKAGTESEDIVRYLHAKHGIERNEYMRRKQAEEAAKKDMRPQPTTDMPNFAEEMDSWNEEYNELVESYVKKFAKRDYSGLTALTESANAVEAEKAAQQMVDEFETAHDTKPLWKAINRATKETLRHNFTSGLIDRATYDSVSTMFDFYIPLRGWDANVAANEYEYLTSNKPMLSPTLKTMHGRQSLADNPLATIAHMAESAIVQGNRNLMKQRFLNFVMNNPTSLATVSEQWYVLNNATNEWEPYTPTIPKEATPEQVVQIVEQFEADMLAKEREGVATRKRAGLKIGLHATKAEGQEHVIRVKRNGKEYCIYINGNPRAAQAVNGLTNPDVSESKAREIAQTVKNFMARAFTSMNPAFIITNLSRDVIWAGTAVVAKEDAAYVKQYTKNITGALFKLELPRLLRKFQKGTLDMNNEVERYFNEFMLNGGETGFTQVNTVEDYKKNIKRFVYEVQNGTRITKKAWRGLWNGVEFLNRSAEDVTRFNVYMTSRQMGRSIAKSVWDAKEITVNFNKKGSGELGAGYMNFAYIFFNATIQSIANFGKIAYNNPGKTGAALAAFSTMGFLMPLINAALMALGDDDDEEMYWNLPDWVRRNNIVLFVPWTDEGFITIPLPHELRPFYGMGEAAYSALAGRQEVEDAISSSARGFTELLPLDFTGNGGDAVINFTPTIAQPIVQIARNTDYFGKPIYRDNPFNKRAPEWTKAYKGTNSTLVAATKWLNELGGGDDVKSGGALDWNPAWIEHAIESYLGGVGKTMNKAYKTVSMIWDEEMREAKNIPVVSSFYQSADEKTEDRSLNERYFNLVDGLEDFEYLLNGYRKKAMMGEAEYEDKFEEMVNSGEFDMYQIVKEYSGIINELNSTIKNYPLNDTEKKDIETTIRKLKLEMLTEVDKLQK